MRNVPEFPEEVEVICWPAENLGAEKQNGGISHCYRQTDIQQQNDKRLTPNRFTRAPDV